MERINDKLTNWASTLETEALLQAERTARLDVVEAVALMPDAHFGKGSTVGSVIATESAIIPAAVGVDIGCGMIAAELTLDAADLPDNLEPYLSTLEQVVPSGVGKGHESASKRFGTLDKREKIWRDKLVPSASGTARQLFDTGADQLGSLGSGNHFVEVCLDETDGVWLVLHSGSRGIGNKLAQKHIKVAKKLCDVRGVRLEDQDLAYLEGGTKEFDSYIYDMLWAQEYARYNREVMMDAALDAFGQFVGYHKGPWVSQRINCHHNFTQRETHDGRELWITRKGAIKADVGDYGVIPGSMGTRSYIVRGLGNADSFNSCSHGAGRVLSRSKAKKMFTIEDLEEQMQGKTWLKDKAASLLDEIPSSYKDIDQVMADQTDLVYEVAQLHQVLNYKGA